MSSTTNSTTFGGRPRSCCTARGLRRRADATARLRVWIHPASECALELAGDGQHLHLVTLAPDHLDGDGEPLVRAGDRNGCGRQGQRVDVSREREEVDLLQLLALEGERLGAHRESRQRGDR